MDSPVSAIFSPESRYSSSSCVISNLQYTPFNKKYYKIFTAHNGSERGRHLHFGHVTSCLLLQSLITGLQVTWDHLVLWKKVITSRSAALATDQSHPFLLPFAYRRTSCLINHKDYTVWCQWWYKGYYNLQDTDVTETFFSPI